MMPSIINTIIISDNPDAITVFKSVFDETQYKIIFENNQLQFQLSEKWMIEPDLIIAIMDKTDLTLLAKMKVIYERYPIPMIVFTKTDTEDGIEVAVDAGVMAYIVDGLQPNRILPILKTAILRFEQQQKTQKEINTLKTTLADRKIIERAKGLVMEQRQCTENEAYKLLRSTAMQQNLRMVSLANNIINASLLLQHQEP